MTDELPGPRLAPSVAEVERLREIERAVRAFDDCRHEYGRAAADLAWDDVLEALATHGGTQDGTD